jgi:hypothetical protein
MGGTSRVQYIFSSRRRWARRVCTSLRIPATPSLADPQGRVPSPPPSRCQGKRVINRGGVSKIPEIHRNASSKNGGVNDKEGRVHAGLSDGMLHITPMLRCTLLRIGPDGSPLRPCRPLTTLKGIGRLPLNNYKGFCSGFESF